MKYMKGDLLELARNGHFDIIVQGCNCFCTMGSGLAKQIKEEYPAAYAADLLTIKGDRSKLGTYTIMRGKFDIVNAYTQYDYNRNGSKDLHFDYHAFDRILNSLLKYSHLNFGFPYIGCGLAGADEQRVIEMLLDFDFCVNAKGGSVTLVEFERK